MFTTLRQNLFKLCKNFFLQPERIKLVQYLFDSIKRNNGNSLFVLSYMSLWYMPEEEITPLSMGKYRRYWGLTNIDQVIQQADNLFEEESYIEVYEMLNKIKYRNEVCVQWRVCRVLHKMAMISDMPNDIKNNMIDEAYELIVRCLAFEDKNPEVHKWMAIILDAKCGQRGTIERVKAAHKVKDHMLQSLELNPKDASILYMLGYWNYKMTNLSAMQRTITTALFFEPPPASFEEAYSYFLKVEQMYPRIYGTNTFMLGKCCYRLGMYYRARYYLELVADGPAMTDYQKKIAEKAKNLAQKLEQYDVSQQALILMH